MMVGARFARLSLFLGALTAVVVAGWWWAAGRNETPIGIVVITLDTTRADRLSPYGYMNVSLPHIERLAREGVIFDQASSVAPLTLPAHTSLFTGLLPPSHGVRDNADDALDESQTTLAETLAARGFRTAAFVSSIVLNPDRGLNQGFEQYRGVDPTDSPNPQDRQRRADAVMSDAIRWLEGIDESPFFLWTHLYDAHQPYDPPEPYATTYGHNPYVGEIAFADSQIGRLLHALAQRQLLERTLVIVVGDHGESLGEHGERDHGVFVYENVIRVPLIVRAPGLQPARIADVVRLTDLMPTALDMLGIPPTAGDGVSLTDLMKGRRSGLKLEAYSESLYPERLGWSPLRSLRDDRFKLIDAPRPELYDLIEDPFEERNIYDERRALAATMASRIHALAKGRGAAAALGQPANATPEWQASLATLGYVASSKAPRARDAASLPDPKDCIGSHARGRDVATVPESCGPRLPTDEPFSAPPAPPSWR